MPYALHLPRFNYVYVFLLFAKALYSVLTLVLSGLCKSSYTLFNTYFNKKVRYTYNILFNIIFKNIIILFTIYIKKKVALISNNF